MINQTPQPPSAAAVKQKQRRTLLIVITIFLVIAWVMTSFLSSHITSARNHQEMATAIEFGDPLHHVNEAKVWVERAQNGIAREEKTTQDLQRQLQQLQAAKAEAEQQSKLQNEQLTNLQNQVKSLTQKVGGRGEGAAQSPFAEGAATGTAVAGVNEDHLALSAQNPLAATTLSTPPIPSKTPDTYVPPGTFVRAVMLGGADASAGVTSQSDPTPMLFRILDSGTLPNHRRSHLKSCVATAAVIGDISSERGQIRLERLSCVAPNGEVVDMPVEGTVFGPEGKNGVRGVPLWREGAFVERAFVAGTLSGLSGGISQQYTTTAVSPLGTTTSVNGSDIFKYGAAQGVSSAMDKLADYNIRRADQYHPVIQLTAGTVVDLVFLKGFYLDGQKHDEKKDTVIPPFSMTATGSAASVSSVPPSSGQNSAPSPLPLTAQQIDALKTRANAQNSL
jgi:conjugal transfer pilus assembly protein TraB